MKITWEKIKYALFWQAVCFAVSFFLCGIITIMVTSHVSEVDAEDFLLFWLFTFGLFEFIIYVIHR